MWRFFKNIFCLFKFLSQRRDFCCYLLTHSFVPFLIFGSTCSALFVVCLASFFFKLGNFHLCFLYRLGRFIGIEPDVSTYQYGRIFDMVDGVFRVTAPLHSQYLGHQEAAVVALLSRMTFDNMHRFRLSRENRNQMLDVILEYYTIHCASLASLKSIDVLRSLFD